MSMALPQLITITLWLALSVLVWLDAAERGEKHWQWGVAVAVTGVVGFAAYVLWAVVPPQSQ